MTGQSVGKNLEDFLQPGVAIRKVYEVLEPNLKFADWVEGPVSEDKAAFTYMYDDDGTSGDALKQTAPLHIVGADLPRIDFGVPSSAAGITSAKGFEVAIPRNIVREGIAGENAIKRTFRKAGYILAQQMDTAILAALVAGADTPDWTPDNTWDNAAATPVKDLMDLQQDFDQKDDGYPYALSDVFLNKDGFYELKEYLNFLDGGQFNDQRPIGKMINRDTIYVKQADVTVHRTTGMSDGYVLGMDANNLGGEMHVFNDPMFSLSGKRVKYPTIENGKKVVKTAPNFGLHFYTYMEKDTKQQILQFWYEAKTVVIQSKSLTYDSGI